MTETVPESLSSGLWIHKIHWIILDQEEEKKIYDSRLPKGEPMFVLYCRVWYCLMIVCSSSARKPRLEYFFIEVLLLGSRKILTRRSLATNLLPPLMHTFLALINSRRVNPRLATANLKPLLLISTINQLHQLV